MRIIQPNRATMEAAENCAHRTLWCVFQPHTYTRTKALLDDFAAALSLADHVVLADIYAARETDTLGISSKDIQERIVKLGTACEYFPSFAEIENYLNENLAEGDMLITMGAGDVVKIGEELLASENKIILSLYLLPVENGVFLFSTGSFLSPNPHNLPFRQIVTHIFIHSYFPVFSPVSELSTLSTILYTFYDPHNVDSCV